MPKNPELSKPVARMALATFILVAGCSRDHREADIKDCIVKAEQLVSQNRLPFLVNAGASAEEKHDIAGGVITDCMQKAGYRFDRASTANARCVDDVAYNPYCYR